MTPEEMDTIACAIIGFAVVMAMIFRDIFGYLRKK